MLDRYAPEEFEAAWRQKWKEADLFLTREDEDRPKFYGLDFFPYPSGAGLSVGHCRNFIPTDVLCRMKYMQGHNVLHPMGFDAFGLPAENEAIKKQRNPAEMIDEYAEVYKRQMEIIGISYDWSRSFKSSDPSYYKWTQWIFKLLYDRGLAYRSMAAVNWDPVDKTVIANEEVIGGRAERSGALVEKKFIPQWSMKITDYAQRLIDDLDTVDWPEGIKEQQRNWIGRSEGVEFEMKIELPYVERKSLSDAEAFLRARTPALAELSALSVTRLEAVIDSLDAGAQEDEDLKQYADTTRKILSEAGEFTTHLLMGSGADSPDGTEAAADSLEDQLEALRLQLQKLNPIEPAEINRIQSIDALLEHCELAYKEIESAFEDFISDRDSADDFVVKTKSNHASFRAFTTRIDTIFGVTFCVLAPEHPAVEKIKASVATEDRRNITEYQKAARLLSDIDRQATTHEKTGVFTGSHAINPVNGARIPIYIADYVLMGYGTGAIMAVPGHDERDYEFAEKYGLEIIPVISPSTDVTPDLPFSAKDGVLINSGEYTGMSVADSQASLGEWMEANDIGERKVNYRLRDWLISRQRYWGCPIPISFDKDGNEETVPDSLLPVTLPDVDNYEPSGDGTSPLTQVPDFVNVTTRDGTLGTRETDTMGGFACSSWYFLRFCDPHNDNAAFDPEKLKYWMPVDTYVGGAEHAVMHLLYARFWTKVLYDAGVVPVNEPFQRLMNQGMLLAQTPYREPKEGEQLHVGEDGIMISQAEAAEMPEKDVIWKWEKMSKSKGNVVTPDEAAEQHGADALRVYELFVAPFEQTIQWSDEGIQGAVRFLSRCFKLASQIEGDFDKAWKQKIDEAPSTASSKEVRRLTHQAIKKATEDIDRFAFNTYISSLMIFLNGVNDVRKKLKAPEEADKLALSEALQTFVLLLSPAAPHSADEIWSSLGLEGTTYKADWPVHRDSLAKEDLITIAVQVNGKLRDKLEVSSEITDDEAKAAAQASEKVMAHTEGKTVRKVIYIPKKLVNIVAN